MEKEHLRQIKHWAYGVYEGPMRRQGGRFKQLGLGFNWVIGPQGIDCTSNWKIVQTIGGEGFSARNVLQTRSKNGWRGLFKFDNRFGEPRTPCKAALKSTMTSIRKFPCFWLLENSDRNFLGNFRKISKIFLKKPGKTVFTAWSIGPTPEKPCYTTNKGGSAQSGNKQNKNGGTRLNNSAAALLLKGNGKTKKM